VRSNSNHLNDRRLEIQWRELLTLTGLGLPRLIAKPPYFTPRRKDMLRRLFAILLLESLGTGRSGAADARESNGK